MTTEASAGEIARLIDRLRAGASTSTDVGVHMRKYQALCDEAADALAKVTAERDEEIQQDQEALADLREHLAAAEARIAELEAGGWQDIETAPKDGRSILIYEREYNLMDRGYYVAGSGWHNGTHKFRYASHWRPLPEAPR